MRELVYLSEAKLEQFLPESSSFWPRPKLSVKLPPFVGVDVDLTSTMKKSQLKHLERVVAQIARTADWFTDLELRPGQWVAFEAPLNYLVLDHPEFTKMLIFTDVPGVVPDRSSESNVRLLLHGSAEYLLNASRPVELAVESLHMVTNCENASSYSRMIDNIEPLLDVLEERNRSATTATRPSRRALSTGQSVPGILDIVVEPYEHSREHLRASPKRLSTLTSRLLHAIDAELSPATSAWMAGYARITANLRDERPHNSNATRYVVASPLYIEYTTPPDA